jgi:hypothetical protein
VATDDLARLLAKDEIRELAFRYALALDSRDFETFAELFTREGVFEGVLTGATVGRDEIARSVARTFKAFGATVHFVSNHVIDLESESTARGVVYTRAEHEVDGQWIVQAMQYWDRYELQDGRWRFANRRLLAWYAVDKLDRPLGYDTMRWPTAEVARRTLPEAWPTFAVYEREKHAL